MTNFFKKRLLKINQKIIKFLRSELGIDIYCLYTIHFISFIAPLLLIPYLARVLGSNEWGLLAFMLSISSLMALFIEYGFYLSAQREAARCRVDKDALARLFNTVLSTKLLVTAFVVTFFLIGAIFFPIFNQDIKLIIGIIFLSTTQAFSFTWYFRGIQRIKVATAMEVISKIIGTFLTIIFIQTPLDFWKYFYTYGVSYAIILIWGFWYVSKTIQVSLPSFSVALNGVRNGGNIFILHATGSIFTNSNVFLIGLLAPYQVVGFFAGAEKITRFLANGMDPIRQAMFPRLSSIMERDREEARVIVVLILLITGGISLGIGCLVYLFAPSIISIVLGDGFFQAIESLRLMAALIPILTLNAGLGFLWMIPRRLEQVCIKVVLFALLLNISLAFLLVPRWQQLGMAASVVIAELLIVIIFFILFIKDKYKNIVFN